MREIERNAPSVDEAIRLALEELGISEQDAEVQVVREPRSGFLGVGRNDAVVRVRRRTEPPVDVDVTAQGEIAADFLEGLLDRMDVDGMIQPRLVQGVMYVDIKGAGDDGGLLIGKYGATLEALQEIVRATVHRRTGERCQVTVDVEDFRKRRRSQLERKTREAVEDVLASGRDVSFEPMNAYERKIVHNAAAAGEGVETISEGEEPNRHVVIRPLPPGE